MLTAVLAYNQHAMTERCIASILDSGYTGKLLLVDNGSTPSFEYLKERFPSLAIKRFSSNNFVNPVWNDLVSEADDEYLSLINNDVLINKGYLSAVPGLMREHGCSLLSCNTAEVDAFDDGSIDLERKFPSAFEIDKSAIRSGHIFTLNLAHLRRCTQFLVPDRYKIFFGDDWFWGTLRMNGFTCGSITNFDAVAMISSTLRRNRELAQAAFDEIKVAKDDATLLEVAAAAGNRWINELEVSEFKSMLEELWETELN